MKNQNKMVMKDYGALQRFTGPFLAPRAPDRRTGLTPLSYALLVIYPSGDLTSV